MSELSNHRFVHDTLSYYPGSWPSPSEELYAPLGELGFDFSAAGIRQEDVYLPIESIAGVATVSERDIPRATMSFKGYRYANETALANNSPQRGMLFCVNGGPISAASGWVGMELYTPSKHEPETSGAHPIFSYKRPIDLADIVYADPPGTGYGRVLGQTSEDYFFGVERDAELMAAFAKSYREAYGGQGGIFLLGCSYSAFRTVAMAHKLLDEGLPFMGIISVSGHYDYKLTQANESQIPARLSTGLYLPAYAATAHYHRRQADSAQGGSLSAYEEAADFTWGPYMEAARSAKRLSPSQQQKLAALTGISRRVWEENDFALSPEQFCSRLLADRRHILSKVDARATYEQGTQSYIDPLLDEEGGIRREALAQQFWMVDPGAIPGGYRFNLSAYPRWPFAGRWKQRDLCAEYSRLLERSDAPVVELNGVYDMLASPEHRKLFWKALLPPDTDWQITDQYDLPSQPKPRTINRHLLTTGHQPALSFSDSAVVSSIVESTLRSAIGEPSLRSRHRADYVGRLIASNYMEGLVEW